MMKKEDLRKYNQGVREKTKDKHEFLQLGFFRGNHICFVGQNPGQPFKLSDTEQTKSVVQEESYAEYEKKYEQLIKDSVIGKYITKVVGETWDHISFTNVVKVPTKDNAQPDESLVEEFSEVLEQQLTFLQPNIVVAFGKFVCNHFGVSFGELKKVGDHWVLGVYHPAFYQRSGKEDEGAAELKSTINDFCKKRCVTRVTNDRVYFRDVSFNRDSYINHVDSWFYFVPAGPKEKPDGFSFDGKPLKKVVPKQNKEWLQIPETYEAHLWSKDIFYYETFGELSHSKMIRYLVYDIETYFCNDILNTPEKVVSIAIYDSISERSTVLYIDSLRREVKNPLFATEYFPDERSMLEAFWKYASEAEVIVGWYSNGFDAPYLINRSRKLGIRIEKWIHDVSCEVTETKEVRWLRANNLVFMDALEFYQRFTYYDKPPSYSLGVVGMHLFGESKIDLEGDYIEVYEKNIDKFLEYNWKDVDLTKRIVDVANVIGYSLRLQQICPQDIENVFFNSKTIENLLHQRYWKKKMYFPTKVTHPKAEFEGAVVLPPVAGVHDNVVVFDFAAMYTSIYITFNISPDTILHPDTENEKKITIESDIGTHSFLSPSEKFGILPALEKEMLVLRDKFKDERDSHDRQSVQYKVADELQGTFKTILNSIYGVAAYERFILYDPRVAASITAVARNLIHFVAKLAVEKEYKVLYGDTDSIFISIDSSSFEDLVEKAKVFQDHINESFPRFIKDLTTDSEVAERSALKVEFEKAFEKLLITKVKKRYFGTLKYRKGKIMKIPELSVVGFETRRDDTPPFFKKVLSEAYELILENDMSKMKEFVKRVKRDICNVDYGELAERKKLGAHPQEYDKNVPIHVRALRNTTAELKRGDKVEMLYIFSGGRRDVTHREPGKTYDIDVKTYVKKFLEQKIRLINEDIADELFNDQRKLSLWLTVEENDGIEFESDVVEEDVGYPEEHLERDE